MVPDRAPEVDRVAAGSVRDRLAQGPRAAVVVVQHRMHGHEQARFERLDAGAFDGLGLHWFDFPVGWDGQHRSPYTPEHRIGRGT
jgi:hypothetical protein